MQSSNDEIQRRQKYSEDTLKRFRERLASASLPSDCTVVVAGSFARGEASSQSDVDYFVLHDAASFDPEKLKQIQQLMTAAIVAEGLKAPAIGGAFAGDPESMDDFLKNVGGTDDTNEKLTRRMLFMLEGEWLTNQAMLYSFRERLINVYVKEDLGDYQLGRFFLNDLIRYWRTIGVDFEFKVTEAEKAWGPRNLKLTFSRKLLYFSGLLMAAETAQQTPGKKRAILGELAKLTPIQRVQKICGIESEKALGWYDDFLVKLSDPGFRKRVEETPQSRKDQSEEFRDLKNCGQYFSWELDRLLHVVYGARHPIHHALVF